MVVSKKVTFTLICFVEPNLILDDWMEMILHSHQLENLAKVFWPKYTFCYSRKNHWRRWSYILIKWKTLAKVFWPNMYFLLFYKKKTLAKVFWPKYTFYYFSENMEKTKDNNNFVTFVAFPFFISDQNSP